MSLIFYFFKVPLRCCFGNPCCVSWKTHTFHVACRLIPALFHAQVMGIYADDPHVILDVSGASNVSRSSMLDE